jgi:hypothetical protein
LPIAGFRNSPAIRYSFVSFFKKIPLFHFYGTKCFFAYQARLIHGICQRLQDALFRRQFGFKAITFGLSNVRF